MFSMIYIFHFGFIQRWSHWRGVAISSDRVSDYIQRSELVRFAFATLSVSLLSIPTLVQILLSSSIALSLVWMFWASTPSTTTTTTAK